MIDLNKQDFRNGFSGTYRTDGHTVDYPITVTIIAKSSMVIQATHRRMIIWIGFMNCPNEGNTFNIWDDRGKMLDRRFGNKWDLRDAVMEKS